MKSFKFGNWTGFTTQLAAIPVVMNKKIERTIFIIGEDVRRSMLNGIANNRFNLKENKKSTKKRKGSSLPLVDKGDLFGSIITKHVDDSAVFIGVLRQSRNRKNESLANIFEIHTLGLKQNGIKMPVRDAITPALKENEENMNSKMSELVSDLIT